MSNNNIIDNTYITSGSFPNGILANCNINTSISDIDNLEKRIWLLEQILNIPQRNFALEHKYPELTQIYQEIINRLIKHRRISKSLVKKYNTAVEKYRNWELLKGNIYET